MPLHVALASQHWCTAAGSLFPNLTAEFPALADHLDGPRFVHLERQVPDAIFVHEDGTRVVILELAWTDDLLEGYWRDRSAAKEEKYRLLREAIAAITGATVAQATLVIGFRGSLCVSEWRAQLEPLPYPRRHLRNSVAVPFAVWFKRRGRSGEYGTRPGANHRWRQER